jgi:hypothetical protein
VAGYKFVYILLLFQALHILLINFVYKGALFKLLFEKRKERNLYFLSYRNFCSHFIEVYLMRAITVRLRVGGVQQ